MLAQEAMIVRLRQVCEEDKRVVAGLLGGSFATGEGDAFSDIDAVLFFSDETLPGLDQRAWLSQIAPLELYFDDDFGHHTAIFANLVRAELHFEPASTMSIVESWRGLAWFRSLDDTLLVDRTGRLTQHLACLVGPPPDPDSPARAQTLTANFLNALLFGVSVLARGEAARALELLGMVHRSLLWMARLVERRTDHWPTPSRAVERDLSAAAYPRYVACTSSLEPQSLWRAYMASWTWGQELLQALLHRHGLAASQALLGKIDQRLADLQQEHASS
jgi:lincosamide nucleotidyltransferase